MKKTTLLVITFLSHYCLSSQTTFQQAFGGAEFEECFSVKQTSDSGYVMAGYTGSFGLGGNMLVVKADKFGNLEWSKTFGGQFAEPRAYIEQTSDGGYAIGGSTESFGAPGENFCLIKTDTVGNIQWMKTYGGNGFERMFSMRQTNTGGFVMVGWTTSFGNPSVYLVVTDSNGNVLWSKTYSDDSFMSSTYGYFVLQSRDQGFFIVGETSSNGGRGLYWLKTDSMGIHQWSGFANTAVNVDDIAKGFYADQTSDGGFIITGESDDDSTNSQNVLLFKLDSLGFESWNRSFGGNNDDRGFFVKQLSDNGFIIIGNTQSYGSGASDVYLIRTNAAGFYQWSKTYGGSDHEYNALYGFNSTSAAVCLDGGFVIGSTTESFGAGQSDFYLVKTDDLGNSGCNETNAPPYFNSLTLWGDMNSTTDSAITIVNNINTTAANTATVNTYLCASVNIQEENSDQPIIHIYPNPFDDQAIISTNQSFVNATLLVYDMYGKLVICLNNINGEQILINRNHLMSGIYVYHLMQGNGIISKGKMMIVD